MAVARNTSLVVVRVSKQERAKLEKLAVAVGGTKSSVVHELIRRAELIPQLALQPGHLTLGEAAHEAHQ